MSKVTRYASARLPTHHGEFNCIVYRDEQELEHVALVHGEIGGKQDVICRIHSECLTSESFGSSKCDCKQQLDSALQEIAKTGTGVLLYLRQEGRGIGLGNKIRAYALQEQGFDTVDANRKLGLPDDAREYQIAADILGDLGITSVVLVTNNPHKLFALNNSGIATKRSASKIPMTSKEALDYIETKRQRMGHLH